MTLNNTTTTLLVTTIVTLLLSSLAWGHAAAQISSPANGAELTQSPKELSIQFNGAAKLVSLTIVDSVGNADKLDISEAKAVDGLISVQTRRPDQGRWVRTADGSGGLEQTSTRTVNSGRQHCRGKSFPDIRYHGMVAHCHNTFDNCHNDGVILTNTLASFSHFRGR